MKRHDVHVNTGYGTENPAIDHVFKLVEEAQAPMRRDGRRITVCAASEIPPGSRRIVEDGALSIGIFNLNGRFYAVKNVCPHQGAPLCRGTIEATHRPSEVHQFDPALHGRVIRCPWHGWEFDIITGQSLHDVRCRVATYPVEVTESGDVVVIV